MELTLLNDDFQPSKLVENHSSLIWSERFVTAGDFSRESNDIGGTLLQLPLWTLDISTGLQKPTLISLRDSTVPMIVETHKIEKSLTGQAKITTTGRSLETVLDRRTTVKIPLGGGVPIAAWSSIQPTAVDAAYDAMNQVVTLGSASLADKIPEFNIKPPLRPAGYVAPTTTQTISVDPGELYSWVLGQVSSENYGLRAVRPAVGTSTFSIEIYTGVDRTDKVIFDARFDQFDTATYLLSQASWKNTDQVSVANDSVEVTDGNTYTGLNRRVNYLDASQTVSGPVGADLTSIMKNLGTVDLAKNLETALFTGEVSRQQGSLYGKDYFLGDIVKLTGDYGLSQFMRIAEFIRSEDNTGEKSYPTFASL